MFNQGHHPSFCLPAIVTHQPVGALCVFALPPALSLSLSPSLPPPVLLPSSQQPFPALAMALPESVVAAAREAPPKPTRIRTATNTSASSVEATASGNTSPDAKAPAPFPQPVLHRRAAAQGGLVKVNALHEHRMFARGRDESGNGCSEKDQQHSDSSTEPATLITSENGSSGSSTGSAAPTQLLANKKPPPVPISKRSQDGTSRAAVAPLPPPKPKRISLAPQPKAKPLSLQSAPLQPRAEHLARPDAASVTQAVSAAVDPTASTAKVTQIPASFST